MTKERVVWIGRNATRAEGLVAALDKLGYKSIVRPAIQIINDTDNNAFQAFIGTPQQYDICIFVSAEAARRCVAAITRQASLPPVLAIGKASAQALAGVFQFAEETDTISDSESLLNTETLKNVGGKKIAVLGGTTDSQSNSLSPFLCSTLTARGALVFPISAYRRHPSPPDNGTLPNLLINGDLIAVVAYSGDTLRQMKIMCPAIIRLPLFVPHSNIINSAQQAGFLQPLLVPTAAEEAAKTIAGVLSQPQSPI